jgi:glutamate synthase domain-containing protein 3
MQRHVRSFVGGYTGLIVILLGTAIIGLLFMKVYLTPKAMTGGEVTLLGEESFTSTTTEPMTEIERGRMEIERAEAVEGMLESHTNATNEAMGE